MVYMFLFNGEGEELGPKSPFNSNLNEFNLQLRIETYILKIQRDKYKSFLEIKG